LTFEQSFRIVQRRTIQEEERDPLGIASDERKASDARSVGLMLNTSAL